MLRLSDRNFHLLIKKIEKPLKPGRKTMEEWLKFVAENQFTLKEMANGTAYETLKYQNED